MPVDVDLTLDLPTSGYNLRLFLIKGIVFLALLTGFYGILKGNNTTLQNKKADTIKDSVSVRR